MKLLLISALLSFTLAFTASCANKPDRDTTLGHQPLSLSEAFSSHFAIGSAINTQQANGLDAQSVAILNLHFNSLTPENDMKWERIQPQENVFTFEASDTLAAYAKKSQKDLIGHALVWHQQTPSWVFEDASGELVGRERLLARMKTHIFAIAGRYKNQIKGWDVVNEAFNEDGSLRESKWYQIIGKDYIEKAFEYAHQAAPKAKLYYNDYNLFKAAKMDGVIAMVKRLQAKGIRIDGIGEQAHYGIEPPIEELDISIQKVADTGLTMMITELDISVLKFPDEDNMGADISLSFALDKAYNPYKKGISASSQEKLANAYLSLFKLFLTHQQHIDRVTLWGVSDNDTWRNDWPMAGRSDYPLLFNRKYKAKSFVSDLIALAQQ